jgi:hypothetical protein
MTAEWDIIIVKLVDSILAGDTHPALLNMFKRDIDG